MEGTAMFTSHRSAAPNSGWPGSTGRGRRHHRSRRACAVVAAAALASAVAACGSSSGSGGSSHAALVVADVAPFSGVDAALGPTYLVSCDGATQAINKAGGVL